MNFSNQREMPWLSIIEKPVFVAPEIVDAMESYRDAVMWAWKHRPARGMNEPDDQAACARWMGVHAPHMTRYVSARTKAPMDLKPDLIPLFETYTGWKVITQFLAKRATVTLMEEVIEQRRAA